MIPPGGGEGHGYTFHAFLGREEKGKGTESKRRGGKLLKKNWRGGERERIFDGVV